MVTPNTKHSNPGWLAKLLKVYKGNRSDLAVGWPAGPAASIRDPDGVQVALKAAVNHYGSASRGIPARPFMTKGGAGAVMQTAPIIEALVPALNAGRITREGILEHTGPTAAGAIKEAILDGGWEANSAATTALKGSAQPLVDTGLLSQSVTYLVRK